MLWISPSSCEQLEGLSSLPVSLWARFVCFSEKGGVKSKGAQQLETTPNVCVETVLHADLVLHTLRNPEAASPGQTAGSALSFPFLMLSAEEQI